MKKPQSYLAHFAINADDVDRARRFYADVFGWQFQAWGPPGFFKIDTGHGPEGALQGRRDLVPGRRPHGFECSIAVDDVDDVIGKVTAAGGTIVMPKATIPGVGTLVFFQDTEGNVAGAMQYEPSYLATMR